jgi:hypothetical protein
MDSQLHRELLKNTDELRKIVGACSTESIVGYSGVYYLKGKLGDDNKNLKLSSQVRQWSFLLGLMLTTAEPKRPKQFDESEIKRAIELLEAIFNAYSWMFWPKPEEQDYLTDEWKQARKVAMPAFLHYFNTALLASVEQVTERINRYLTPFDDLFEQLIGIPASDTLNITKWIGNSVQAHLNQLIKAFDKEATARLALIKRAEAERWDMERLRHEAHQETYMPLMENVMSGLQGMFKVQLSALEEEFGTATAHSYWKQFISRRGEVSEFTYLTERNIAEEKPLFEVSAGVAMCPSANVLYFAVLKVGEQILINSHHKESYLRRRDEILEREVEDKLHLLFGDSADFFSNVFETPDLHYEHDLILKWERRLFVVEAKASPPPEPFRDPDKAFIRIKRAFQSQTGIQKAFDQANRIRRQLAAGNTVQLYDSNQALVATIRPEDIEQTYCVCVTRDNFGYLAVDLSLLLEKDGDDPYPWAVNILDLQTLLDGWAYLKWGPEKLCDYLDARIKLHGKVFTTDELVIAGFYITHGGLSRLVSIEEENATLVLDEDYSDVFDKMYFATRGGEEFVYAPTEPYIGDLRRMISEVIEKEQRSQLVIEPTAKPRIKQGRNERCACGSGLKYKRCCGW